MNWRWDTLRSPIFRTLMRCRKIVRARDFADRSAASLRAQPDCSNPLIKRPKQKKPRDAWAFSFGGEGSIATRALFQTTKN